MNESVKGLQIGAVPINRVSETVWEIPESHRKKMRVPARIIGTREIVSQIEEDALKQIVNVASMPGIVDYALMMPDTHLGYGMPVGGVAAFDPKNGGVISPGAIGFDINCGMRLISTSLTYSDIEDKIPQLVQGLFNAVPAGVGKRGFLSLSHNELEQLMLDGAQWMIRKGYGWEEDKEHMEEHGRLAGADPEAVSKRARDRGIEQIATLGSGNHYLEIQKVDKVYDTNLAGKMMLNRKNQIVVMIHSGSRGFGHQNCSDYLKKFERKMPEYGIKLDDKQLACLPYESTLGRRYYGAMAAAVNYAFANRQGIMHRTRQVFEEVLRADAKKELNRNSSHSTLDFN